MSDEFSSMLERVSADRVEARRQEQVEFSEAQTRKKYEFDTKAKCLREVVFPYLSQAAAAFAAKGVNLEILTNLEGDNFDADPFLSFRFKPTLGGSQDYDSGQAAYYLTITHTQGGARCGIQDNHGQMGNKFRDLSKNFNIRDADNLSREFISKFLEFALVRSARN